MARIHIFKSESGFTLIELIVVMAISASLVSIAFIGQRSLRSQAQFDSAVEKVVSSVSSAQTQAVAGVNILGAGDGLAAGNCPTGPPPSTANPVVFAGTSWTADDQTGTVVFTIDSYKAIPGLLPFQPSASCVFYSQAIALPTGVQISAPFASVGNVSGMLFVRTNSGSLDVCPAAPKPNANAFENNARQSFENATCVNGTLSLTLKDLDGHTSDIRIDASGLARRLN
jgi:prepilin-type N-terminal cleavage/methylation domain-containing protein